MLELNLDILTEILGRVSLSTLGRLGRVSRDWHAFIGTHVKQIMCVGSCIEETDNAISFEFIGIERRRFGHRRPYSGTATFSYRLGQSISVAVNQGSLDGMVIINRRTFAVLSPRRKLIHAFLISFGYVNPVLITIDKWAYTNRVCDTTPITINRPLYACSLQEMLRYIDNWRADTDIAGCVRDYANAGWLRRVLYREEVPVDLIFENRTTRSLMSN